MAIKSSTPEQQIPHNKPANKNKGSKKKTACIILIIALFLLCGISIAAAIAYYFLVYLNSPEAIKTSTLDSTINANGLQYNVDVDLDTKIIKDSVSVSAPINFDGKVLLNNSDNQITAIDIVHKESDELYEKNIEFKKIDENYYIKFADINSGLIIKRGSPEWVEIKAVDVEAGYHNFYLNTILNNLVDDLFFLDLNKVINFLKANSSSIIYIENKNDSARYSYSLELPETQANEIMLQYMPKFSANRIKDSLNNEKLTINYFTDIKTKAITEIEIKLPKYDYTFEINSKTYDIEGNITIKYDGISIVESPEAITEPDKIITWDDYIHYGFLVHGNIRTPVKVEQYNAVNEKYGTKALNDWLEKLEMEYIATNKVSYTYYPSLIISNFRGVLNATWHYNAYLCAFEQDAGLEILKAIIKEIQAQGENAIIKYDEIARKYNIQMKNATEFISCTSKMKYRNEYTRLVKYASSQEIKSSPYFYLSNNMGYVEEISGYKTWDQIKSIIDKVILKDNSENSGV